MVIGKITYNKTVVRGIRGIGYGGTGGVMRGGGVTKEIRGVQGMGKMLQMGGGGEEGNKHRQAAHRYIYIYAISLKSYSCYASHCYITYTLNHRIMWWDNVNEST